MPHIWQSYRQMWDRHSRRFSYILRTGPTHIAKLIYMMNTSLDGYIEDEQGGFGWGAPNDPELHTWLFEHVMTFRTLLYGRKVYETMLYWETAHTLPNQEPRDLEFARYWQAAEKIVYSRTLTEPRSAHTKIERSFDPEAIRKLKTTTGHDIAVAGPELAAQAIHVGLVDEIQMRICPVLIGGGKRFLPNGARLDLQLLGERRFRNGDVFLRYSVASRQIRSNRP